MTVLTGEDFRQFVIAMAGAITDNAERLTTLDSAIGDGDHGANMKRGFDAVVGDIDVLAEKSFAEATKAAGLKLVMTVGGASGPLVGTFFMTLGKELPEGIDRKSLAAAFATATAAVAARGKSERGQKTLLDVLYPLHAAIAAGADAAGMARAAQAAAEATIPVKATRGRASFLGDRSIGHMDPGSASVALLADAAARVWAART